MARILVVDDDESMSAMLTDFLEVEKHQVETAADGEDGFGKLSSNTYQLAILDWDMPRMSGVEVCKKFRDGGGQTPILLLTGRTQEDEKEAGLDAGADDYLTKPFSLKELGARVRSLLRRAGATLSGDTDRTIQSSRVCTSCGNEFDASDATVERCPNDGAATVVVSTAKVIGKSVCGDYKITALIGVGAWGEVYKATNATNGSEAAVKILHTHLSADPLKVARFNREAEALLRLQHEGLARVYAQGVIDGRPCLVMEYLQGTNLEKYLAERGRISLADVAAIFLPVCDALEAAHRQGLIHRDLKPSNVFLVQDGTSIKPKVLDFGLAKIKATEGGALASLTQNGEVLGTPAYMSPEQCLGDRLDARCDLYALGLLIYEALTGCRATPGRTVFEAMTNQINRYPDPIADACPDAAKEVSREVEDLIFRLLQKDPEARFTSAREFATLFSALTTI
jgi:serine/threonine-protein kinase